MDLGNHFFGIRQETSPLPVDVCQQTDQNGEDLLLFGLGVEGTILEYDSLHAVLVKVGLKLAVHFYDHEHESDLFLEVRLLASDDGAQDLHRDAL